MNEAEKYLAARKGAGQEFFESLGTINYQKENATEERPRNGDLPQPVRKDGARGKLFGLALISGLFAILAAILRQLTIGLPDLLAALLVAPPVEEILKIAIPIMVLEHRTKWIKKGWALLFFAMGSALVFAVVENLLYTFIYLKDPSAELLWWRWGACTAMHVVATGLSGVGLMRAFNRGQRDNQSPRFVWEWPWLAGAIALHMAYNTFAVFFAEPF